MVIGTPDASYSADEAAALLHKAGNGAISAAMDRLLSRNVLSKLVKDPTKAVPGRTLKISEMSNFLIDSSIKLLISVMLQKPEYTRGAFS